MPAALSARWKIRYYQERVSLTSVQPFHGHNSIWRTAMPVLYTPHEVYALLTAGFLKANPHLASIEYDATNDDQDDTNIQEHMKLFCKYMTDNEVSLAEQGIYLIKVGLSRCAGGFSRPNNNIIYPRGKYHWGFIKLMNICKRGEWASRAEEGCIELLGKILKHEVLPSMGTNQQSSAVKDATDGADNMVYFQLVCSSWAKTQEEYRQKQVSLQHIPRALTKVQRLFCLLLQVDREEHEPPASKRKRKRDLASRLERKTTKKT